MSFDVVAGIFVLILLAIIVGLFAVAVSTAGFVVLGIVVAVLGYRMWKYYENTPSRREAREYALLMQLYEQAQHFTAENLADRLDDLPVPRDTKGQLKLIGQMIYKLEGGLYEVPPPPLRAHSLEGARYKDMIGDLGRNQAILDKVEQFIRTAASYVPNSSGNLTVPLKQFLPQQVFVDLCLSMPSFDPDSPGPYPLLLTVDVPYELPDELRPEHMWIVGGTGHGKSQALQYLIKEDLGHDRTVIVIDSQGDLINTVLKSNPKNVVLIDAEDVEYPVSLNLFGIGQERLASYSPLERERLTNSVLELYDFVLSSLLDAGMTQKQNVIFRYVTRLMLHIPGATIHTLREVLERDGSTRYREAINSLTGTARHFFENEFDGKEFQQTRSQVLRRLYGVLENQTFERMFSHPVSKFDMFTEMNAGKLILINTAKSLLKEEGTKIFGRFFIALIAQAAQERATITDRKRVHVYIDEAQDYFDDNIGLILTQARKYNVGLTVAHQYLGQLTPQLQQSFEANTSIKMAGGVSARDAAVLARQMNTTAESIQHADKGTFMAAVKGQATVPLSIPFGVLTGDGSRVSAIRDESRRKYAEPVAVPEVAGEVPEMDEIPERGIWRPS